MSLYFYISESIHTTGERAELKRYGDTIKKNKKTTHRIEARIVNRITICTAVINVTPVRQAGVGRKVVGRIAQSFIQIEPRRLSNIIED